MLFYLIPLPDKILENWCHFIAIPFHSQHLYSLLSVSFWYRRWFVVKLTFPTRPHSANLFFFSFHFYSFFLRRKKIKLPSRTNTAKRDLINYYSRWNSTLWISIYAVVMFRQQCMVGWDVNHVWEYYLAFLLDKVQC